MRGNWKCTSSASTIATTRGAMPPRTPAAAVGRRAFARWLRLDGAPVLTRDWTPSDLLRDRAAEDAAGLEEQHENQDTEHVHVAQRRREVCRAEKLEHSDEQPAEHRPADVPDPSDDRRDESLET